MKLQCLSFQFTKCSLETKGKLVLNDSNYVAVYERIRETLGISELLILSTCNRTELYFFSDTDQTQELFILFKALQGINDLTHCKNFSISDHEKSLQHLCEVSLGIHSQVLGDVQVIHQVKEAYRKAVDLGGAKVLLHKIMHRVFALNKYVTNNTDFKKGVSSVSSATVQLVKRIHKTSEPILILGTGESSKETIKNLLSSGYRHLTLINRTEYKATEMAEQYGLKHAPIEDLKGYIRTHRLVITSLGTNEKVVNSSNVPMEISSYQYRYFLDLSVLGVVDRAIESNPENLVFGIEYMVERNEETQRSRMNELVKVRELIAQEIDSYLSWYSEVLFLNKLESLTQDLNSYNKQQLIECLQEFKKNNQMNQTSVISVFEKFQLICQKENKKEFMLNDLYSIFEVETNQNYIRKN